MLSIILHATFIHHSNVCDIDRNSCILLFKMLFKMNCIVLLLLYMYIVYNSPLIGYWTLNNYYYYLIYTCNVIILHLY